MTRIKFDCVNWACVSSKRDDKVEDEVCHLFEDAMKRVAMRFKDENEVSDDG